MQFQNIWLSVNSDLEYAKTSLQELFYVLDLDMEADKVKALVEVADVITARDIIHGIISYCGGLRNRGCAVRRAGVPNALHNLVQIMEKH